MMVCIKVTLIVLVYSVVCSFTICLPTKQQQQEDNTQSNRSISNRQHIELIKRQILEQLHLHEADLDDQKDQKNERNKSYYQQKLKSAIYQNAFENLQSNVIKALIIANEEDGGEDNKDLIYHFRFGHSIFKGSKISNAKLSFYKVSQVDEVEKEILAVAEVFFDHVHVINHVKETNTKAGWVDVDIKDHVLYWAEDFDDGLKETRTLQIMCINCKSVWTSKHSVNYLPFITIELVATNS